MADQIIVKSGVTPLGESNYHSWAAQVTGLAYNLVVKAHLDGNVPQPTIPAQNPTAEDHRELREWTKTQSMAIGLLLSNVSENNRRLIENQTPPLDAHGMWEALRLALNRQDSTNQFSHLQELMNSTNQKRGESLTSFLSRILLASDKVLGSFPPGTTAVDMANILIPYIALNHLQDTDENHHFVKSIKVIGGITKGVVNEAFINEQKDRDRAKQQAATSKSENANTVDHHYTNKSKPYIPPPVITNQASGSNVLRPAGQAS